MLVFVVREPVCPAGNFIFLDFPVGSPQEHLNTLRWDSPTPPSLSKAARKGCPTDSQQRASS